MFRKNFSSTNSTQYLFWIFILFFISIHSLSSMTTTDYTWHINFIDFYLKNNFFYDLATDTHGGWNILYISLNTKIVELFENFFLFYSIVPLFYSIFGIYICNHHTNPTNQKLS